MQALTFFSRQYEPNMFILDINKIVIGRIFIYTQILPNGRVGHQSYSEEV